MARTRFSGFALTGGRREKEEKQKTDFCFERKGEDLLTWTALLVSTNWGRGRMQGWECGNQQDFSTNSLKQRES